MSDAVAGLLYALLALPLLWVRRGYLRRGWHRWTRANPERWWWLLLNLALGGSLGFATGFALRAVGWGAP